jgi:hypothetical protein
MIQLSAYSADQPLLLVTDYPPDMGGGGAVILRSLLDKSARQRMVWAFPSLEPATSGLQSGTAALTSRSRNFSPDLRRRSPWIDSLFA